MEDATTFISCSVDLYLARVVFQVLSWSKMASDRMATPQSSSRQSSSLSSSPMRRVEAEVWALWTHTYIRQCPSVQWLIREWVDQNRQSHYKWNLRWEAALKYPEKYSSCICENMFWDPIENMYIRIVAGKNLMSVLSLHIYLHTYIILDILSADICSHWQVWHSAVQHYLDGATLEFRQNPENKVFTPVESPTKGFRQRNVNYSIVNCGGINWWHFLSLH